MSAGPVYFIADAHLGVRSREREAPREERLHAFLGSLAGRASALVIVGDLFDFWFEYRTAIPRRHFATLAILRRLRESGVALTYLNGNHDFWLGRFLAAEVGIETHDGPLALEAQGRRLWVHHGDGLVGGDLGYRLLRSVIRHPASIALYGLLHPDLGIPLAHQVSRWSRQSRGREPARAGAAVARDRAAALRRGLRRRAGGPLPPRLRAARAGAGVLPARRLDHARHLRGAARTARSGWRTGRA